MSGIDGIINFKKDEREDYYRVLGCTEDATIDQINAEYKIRALMFHPDKNAGDKDAEVKFQMLTEAKDVLTDPEKRNVYDKWRNSGIAITYKQWLGMKDAVHQSMHWSTPKTKDRMLPGTGGSSGPSSLGTGGVNPAHRRASEGGANLHYGGRNVSGWNNDTPSDVVNKFRNYEI